METGVSWLWPLAAAVGVSSSALLGSGLLLLLGRRAERTAGWLLAFAVGSLLGAALLLLLPEALEHVPPGRALPVLLAGIVGFILFEKVLRWRHPHHLHEGEHTHVERVTGVMLLWGDALHNLVDGLVLGVAFHAGPEVGLATSMAIFTHEVPQELADFAILLGTGMARTRALLLNFLSALAVVPGALLSFAWAGAAQGAAGWLLPLAAGGFLYIALANLVPALHHRQGTGVGLLQMALLLLGIAAIWGLGLLPLAEH